MNLNENDIKELLDNAFFLDFIEITLTQMGGETPIIYSGPGTISRNEDGMLHSKLNHTFVDFAKELFGVTAKLVPGKIIGDEHYFSLRAKDTKGHVWVAKWILPEAVSFHAAGRVIESEITELSKEDGEKHANSSSSCLFMLVKGDYQIPPNEREELPNGGSWWNTFRIQSESYHLKLRAKDGYLTIEMDGRSEHLTTKTGDILLESLSIVFGKLLTPIYSEFENEEVHTIKLFSVPIQLSNLKIHAPIPHTAPHHFEPVKEFIENYLKVFSEPWGNFYGYWHKIIHASQGRTENVALALTVAIEGIIKHYFQGYGLPDEEFKKEIEIALDKIESCDIGDRVKGWITSSLKGARKNSRPTNALKKFADDGWFEKELRKAWDILRNKSTHADKLDGKDFQKFIDRVNRCLLLFYSLLFMKIEYKNTYFDFASEGWPKKTFVRPPDINGLEKLDYDIRP